MRERDLRGDETVDGAGEDLGRDVPAVLARQVVEQEPALPGRDDRGHQPGIHLAEHRDDARLVGRERRRGLQPDRP